ncbi:hypothetical protein EJ08DRAFT_683083 [Tothia fuscella]|uniref:Uncharacterized protein n=1 Tax=Tothia fuscella TaxID=1048955 RepID=A0A9P4NH55_9PEZI|nr:hypothetical protein EJ08DRAFT_683083 [Tothia fuscella]
MDIRHTVDHILNTTAMDTRQTGNHMPNENAIETPQTEDDIPKKNTIDTRQTVDHTMNKPTRDIRHTIVYILNEEPPDGPVSSQDGFHRAPHRNMKYYSEDKASGHETAQNSPGEKVHGEMHENEEVYKSTEDYVRVETPHMVDSTSTEESYEKLPTQHQRDQEAHEAQQNQEPYIDAQHGGFQDGQIYWRSLHTQQQLNEWTNLPVIRSDAQQPRTGHRERQDPVDRLPA